MPDSSGLLVVIAGVSPVTVRLKSFVEDRLLPPVTRTVKLAVPATEGVPLITPPLLRLKPAGRLPALMTQV